MHTLLDIDNLAKQFASALGVVRERVLRVEDEVEAVRRRLGPGIKSAVVDLKSARAQLDAAILDADAVFAKPRTLILHGIKVGFQKQKGKLSWAKEKTEQIIKAIRRLWPDEASVLIKTAETPQKKVLNGKPAADLRKLGITVIEAGDKVVIAPVDTGVDKFVKALLKEENSEDDDE